MKKDEKKIFTTLLSFPHHLAVKDMEDYEKWIIGGSSKLSKERLKEMRILGILNKLGYSLEHVGTHLFKEFIVEISNNIDIRDYKKSIKVLHDVSSEKSSIRKSLACDYLEISDGLLMKNIKEATNQINQKAVDKEYERKIYGPNGKSKNIGIMAYKVAQYYNSWEESFESQLIGSFVATTFSNEDIIFNVYDNNTIECKTLEIDRIRNINLKPRFELNSEVMHYTYDASNKIGEESKLIKEYDIDNNLMNYLISNGMVKYSQDMAILYGFDPEKAFDRNGGYPFKRAVKKGPILKNQKEGYFN